MIVSSLGLYIHDENKSVSYNEIFSYCPTIIVM